MSYSRKKQDHKHNKYNQTQPKQKLLKDDKVLRKQSKQHLSSLDWNTLLEDL